MEHLALALLVIAVPVLIVRGEAARWTIAQVRRRVRDAEANSPVTTYPTAVGAPVSGLVHDLKTSIQGVMGDTEGMLATGEHGGTNEVRDFPDEATGAAGTIGNLIPCSEATGLVRRWQDDLNEGTAPAIAAAHAQIFAAGNRVPFVPAERLPLVYVDSRQLQKAVSTALARAGAVRIERDSGDARVPITVSTRLHTANERPAIDIEFGAVPQDAVERALAAGELDASPQTIEAHDGRLSRTTAAGVRIELPATLIELADSPHSHTTTAQESSSSWTTLSTSSTSTASGTSTN